VSSMYGIFDRTGSPVDLNDIGRMQAALSYWNPDAGGIRSCDPVAFGHGMLWNTPESKRENLPALREHLLITMDSRLDNRSGLIEELDIQSCTSGQITDSECILAAYRRWGGDCPKHLLGDFSFAIWDTQKQQLFCARDHIGIKQFYYYADDERFMFANDLRGFQSYDDITDGINDEAIANFLVNSTLLHDTFTFFKKIKKLPPAHSMTVTAKELTLSRYWRAEDTPRVKLSDAQAYAKKLRELIEQAVSDRVRSDYPVASHLSGGLDSSTVSVIAARKLREKGECLSAFNWLHNPTEDDNKDHYEWSNSKIIAEIEGINHHYVTLTAEALYRDMKEHTVLYGDTARIWYERPVREAVQQSGGRTILTGWDGDGLATYHGMSYYSNLATNGHIIKALRELKKLKNKKRTGLRPLLGAVYHLMIIPFVPRALYCKMPKNRYTDFDISQYVNADFHPMLKKEKKKKRAYTMQPQIKVRNHMLAYLNNGHIQSRIESWAASQTVNRLEYTYPLLDKRIVEFILGVPPEYFVENGIGRYLFRSAAKGLLPEEILWTNVKPEPQRVKYLLSLAAPLNGLMAEGEFFSETDTAYIDPEKFKNMMKAAFSSSSEKEETRAYTHLLDCLSLLKI
jgi:asparagine synthase (glutamine-hydrolysing)